MLTLNNALAVNNPNGRCPTVNRESGVIFCLVLKYAGFFVEKSLQSVFRKLPNPPRKLYWEPRIAVLVLAVPA